MRTYQKFTDNIYREIDEYITSYKPFTVQYETIVTKDGKTFDKPIIKPNFPPSLYRFCREYKYDYGMLCKWRSKKNDQYKGDIFRKATNEIRKLRASTIDDLALTGNYNAQYAKFRKNIENHEVEKSSTDITTDGEKLNNIVYLPQKKDE
jgi:hypothetical protein